MRVALLDPGVLEQVRPGDVAERWRIVLAPRGFFAEPEGQEAPYLWWLGHRLRDLPAPAPAQRCRSMRVAAM